MDTYVKQNVFKQFFQSFYNFNAYPNFLKQRGGKVFLYSFLMIVITFIVTFVVPSLYAVPYLLGMDNSVIDDNIPYFEISGGRFFIEHPLILDDPVSGSLFYITSDKVFPTETAVDVMRDYSAGIIIDAEKIIVKSTFQPTEVLSFASAPDFYFSRAELYPIIPVIKTFVIIMYPVLFIFYIGAYMFGVLVCSLIGMAVNAFIKAPVDFTGIYKLTAYARTTPIILKMLLILLPFGIQLNFLAFYAIFILYMVWALLAVKKESEQPRDEIINVSDISDNF